MFQRADVRYEADIAALVDTALDRFGRLDCMFNNAGDPVPGTLDSVTEGDLLNGTRLLLGSVVFGIQHAARAMRQGGHGGSIINNSSVAAWRYRQVGLVYSIMKAGVSHLTRLAGVELGPYGIRVNAISPGAMATPTFLGRFRGGPATR